MTKEVEKLLYILSAVIVLVMAYYAPVNAGYFLLGCWFAWVGGVLAERLFLYKFLRSKSAK